MRDVSLRRALGDYKTVYMPYRNFAERTRTEYLNDLEDLVEFLGRMGVKRAGEIKTFYLVRYLAELDRRGFAGSTRKRKVISIRSFLWYLYQDGYISNNLSKRVIPPLAEAKSPRYLTKLEYEQLVKASAQNPRDHAVVQLILQTGIKLSELTKLTINDIELPANLLSEVEVVGYLHIRGMERRKGRIIPLNYKACIALDTYLRKRSPTTNPALFLNRFGTQLGPRGVEKIVNKYLGQQSIPSANVQSLRHTFAVHQLAKGSGISTIQKVMGYGDPRSMTQYVSLIQMINAKHFKVSV